MDTLTCFSTSYTKGKTFHYFHFASLDIPNGVNSKSKEFAPLGHFWYNSVIESTAFSNLRNKLQDVYVWYSSPDHVRVTDEAWIAETTKYGPSFSFRM